jgi:hypothetical protein
LVNATKASRIKVAREVQMLADAGTIVVAGEDENGARTYVAATCTGTVYDVNPDAPEEGTDVHHDGPCPEHAEVAPVISLADRAKAADKADHEALAAVPPTTDGVVADFLAELTAAAVATRPVAPTPAPAPKAAKAPKAPAAPKAVKPATGGAVAVDPEGHEHNVRRTFAVVVFGRNADSETWTMAGGHATREAAESKRWASYYARNFAQRVIVAVG